MRKAVLVAGCLILLEGVAFPQNPPATSPSQVSKQDLCAVSGQVVRAGTGEPLKKAHVSLSQAGGSRPGESYGAQTNEAGMFSVENVQPGRYYLNVERTGYVTQSYGETSSRGSGAILTLGPGEKAHDLVFRLVPWAAITGRITDEDGEPVPRVRVMALRRVFSRGRRTLSAWNFTQTNDLGEFRLWGLRPGRYIIRAESDREIVGRGVGTRPAGKDDAYAPIFYPGTPDAARAGAIDVRAGQDMPGVDFILIPTHAVRVRGRVFDAVRGQPVGCCVELHSAESYGFSTFGGSETMDPKSGTFEIRGVVPGSYEVLAYSESDGRMHFARRRVEVGETDVEGVDLTISRGADLKGRVIVEGQGSVDLSDVDVSLDLAELDLRMGGMRGEVKADGTFTIPDVSEGAYDIYVRHPPGSYLKAVRVSGQDVLEAGLSVGTGGIKGSIEVVLSTAGATVEGVVTGDGGLPVPGATVALVPDGDKRKVYRLYRSETTDQYGKFVFRDVRPGEYKLFSWREVDYGDWQDPDFLKPVEDRGVKITTEENGHVTVELKVISSVPVQ